MEFKVIRGGKDPENKYSFVSGAVTDTRLMGVLGLHIHWQKQLEYTEEPVNLHQFFYFDVEELGLDSIRICDTDSETDVNTMLRSCFGGLGAVMWQVTEKEARYLVQYFVRETLAKKQPLIPEAAEIKFITAEPVTLSEEELSLLNRKMCTLVKTDYGVVNYYLMRCFGKDEEGAALLRSPKAPAENFDDVSLRRHATFLQNNIEEFTDENGRLTYLSESLVESENGHSIIVTETEVKDGKVSSVRLKSKMNISVPEASMLLNKGEFVTVYEIVSDMDSFDLDFADITLGTTRTGHECGDLYMEFKPDNSHAESPHFRLSDDVAAIYFVTDYGQLVVGAYSIAGIMAVENRILNAKVMRDVCPTGKFQFAQSIIYEFALSGYTDFGEFIEAIRE